MSHIQYFSVRGTTCTSCEVAIERAVRTISGVEKVIASHSRGVVTVTVRDGVTLQVADLVKTVGGEKYRFAPLDLQQKMHAAAQKTGASHMLIAGLFVAAVYVVLDRTGVLQFSPDVRGAAGYASVFVVGLVAAFSSCTAVVGGLIAAVSARHSQMHATESVAAKMRPHVLFNAGRLVGFAGFGALIGLLGQALQFSSTMNGVLIVLIAVIMVVLGAQLMDVLPQSVSLYIRMPKWLAHYIHALGESDKPWVPAMLGALTFFLPCGFTQSMQVYAMSTGNPWQAAAIMAVFALGTMPALLGVGYVTSAVRGVSLKQLTYVIGAVVIAIGIANFVNGATLLGLRVSPTASTAVSATQKIVGEQIIAMEVSSAGKYVPDTLKVKVGIPVVWQITGDDFMGCATTLVMPAFHIRKDLVTGMNIVKFTPDKAGTYPFSCAMGMVRGTMIVEK